MKKVLFIILLLPMTYATISCISAQKISKNQETKNPINKNITAEEFKELIDAGKGTLLDVRTANEVAQGSISGSVNIDYYSAIFKDEVNKLDKNKAVYVYCRSGNRSGKAMKIMTDLGFVEVYNLIGGYGSWPYK